jgi:hypothetical protein
VHFTALRRRAQLQPSLASSVPSPAIHNLQNQLIKFTLPSPCKSPATTQLILNLARAFTAPVLCRCSQAAGHFSSTPATCPAATYPHQSPLSLSPSPTPSPATSSSPEPRQTQKPKPVAAQKNAVWIPNLPSPLITKAAVDPCSRRQ